MTANNIQGSDPIRVLHVTGLAPAGGVHTVLLCYFNVADLSVSQDLIYSQNRVCEDLERLVSKKKATVYRLPYLKAQPIRYIFQLCRFYKEHSAAYDIIHIHAPTIGFLDAVFARIFGCRHIIVHSHTAGGTPNPLKRMANYIFSRISLLFANHYLACSICAGKYLFGNRPFTTINNSINLDEYSYSSEKRALALKLIEPIGSNTKRIVHVGSLIRIKNQEFLVKLMDLIVNKLGHANYSLYLIGEGVMRSALEKMIARFNLQSNIFLLGYRRDVSLLLNAFDIMVLPSLSEGFSLSLLEAQANGLPCLVSDRVPTSVARNSNIQYLSINSDTSLTTWARIILDGCLKREDDMGVVRKNLYGFNETSVSEAISQYYESIVEE